MEAIAKEIETEPGLINVIVLLGLILTVSRAAIVKGVAFGVRFSGWVFLAAINRLPDTFQDPPTFDITDRSLVLRGSIIVISGFACIVLVNVTT